jgi:hypothetical protein
VRVRRAALDDFIRNRSQAAKSRLMPGPRIEVVERRVTALEQWKLALDEHDD